MFTRLPIRSRFLTVTTLVGLLVAFRVSSADPDALTSCALLRVAPLSILVPDVSTLTVIVTIQNAQWPDNGDPALAGGTVRLFERHNPTTGALEQLSDELLFRNVGPDATIQFRNAEGGTPMDGPFGFIYPFQEELGGNLQVTIGCRLPIRCMDGTGLPVSTIAFSFSSDTEAVDIIDSARVAISRREALVPTCQVISP